MRRGALAPSTPRRGSCRFQPQWERRGPPETSMREGVAHLEPGFGGGWAATTPDEMMVGLANAESGRRRCSDRGAGEVSAAGSRLPPEKEGECRPLHGIQ
jgi:hypothetical protein